MRAEIRFIGAPCSASDYEIVWSGPVTAVDRAWNDHISQPQLGPAAGEHTVSTAVLNHQVVVIEDDGREYLLDDAPDYVIALAARRTP